jgi:hypothetical protein
MVRIKLKQWNTRQPGKRFNPLMVSSFLVVLGIGVFYFKFRIFTFFIFLLINYCLLYYVEDSLGKV